MGFRSWQKQCSSVNRLAFLSRVSFAGGAYFLLMLTVPPADVGPQSRSKCSSMQHQTVIPGFFVPIKSFLAEENN